MRKAIIEERDVFDRETPLPDGCQTIAEDIQQLYNDEIISKNTRDAALITLKH